MANANMGFRLQSCSECERRDVGNQLYSAFRGDCIQILHRYDKETDTILVNRAELMRLIQMVNPCQQIKSIRLADMVVVDHHPTFVPVQSD